MKLIRNLLQFIRLQKMQENVKEITMELKRLYKLNCGSRYIEK